MNIKEAIKEAEIQFDVYESMLFVQAGEQG